MYQTYNEDYSEYGDFLERFVQLIKIYSKLLDSPKNYGTDELFHPLEIHTIHVIGENPGINITEIARYHDISKSAVSQVVKKLEKRGRILRYKATDNNKEVLLKLTDKGIEAYKGHIEFHKEMDKPLIKMFQSMGDEKLEVLKEVLEALENRTKLLIKE